MKNINIQKLIYGNYLKSSLIPIFVIEVTLLFLYFGINYYISEKNRVTLLEEATKNIREIASLEVRGINNQLHEVRNLALIMQNDHQQYFTTPNSCFFPNGEPTFDTHDNGAYFKTSDNGGSSLYYASATPIGETERRKARCSERLDPLLQSIVETNVIITQAYLNTWDDMNRLYPFMEDAPSQYGPSINMEDYNFYYEADTAHNPERNPVWTGAYLDPAGQGWMISIIVPIYNMDFLEGVSGLDVTIDSFVQNILNLEFPWKAGVFMIDKEGVILAMQEKIEHILQLQELGGHDYSENILETIEKPDQFNVLNHADNTLTSQLRELFDSQTHIGSIVLGDVEYMVSQEIVEETGWRMITLIETASVLAPISQLKSLSDKIGFAAVLLMILFYTVFFAFLIHRSKNLSSTIAVPISKLANRTKDLGKRLESEPLGLSGISEVDMLTKNFDTMSHKLHQAIQEAYTAREEADSVISNFLDSLLVVDRNLNISRINKETCNLLGVDEDEVLNTPVMTLFDEPENQVKSYFSFPFETDNKATNELRNIELTFLTKTGNKLPVSINLARVNNESGETVGVVAGAKDVSELKEALSQARRQQQFIQRILDTIPGGILVIDDDFQITQTNDTYNRLINTWVHQYDIDREKLTSGILKGLTASLPGKLVGEIVIAGIDSSVILEFHASSDCVQTDTNRRVVFLHDVTLRHNAEAVRKLQSTVLEQTSEAVFITDTNGIILNCNLAAQTMSGYSQEAIIGQSTSIFKSGDHDAALYKEMWKTLQKGQVWTGSVTNRAKDGSLFETEISMSPVRSTGNEITHYVSLWRDVSQIRYLQQQLLHAQKLESIGQLAAGVAHEINTPIQYIMSNLTFFKQSFSDLTPLLQALVNLQENAEKIAESLWQQNITQLIEDSGLDFLLEEIPDGIEDALSGVNHVADIVNALKEFSHPGKGNKSLTDINRLISNALTVTQNELKYVAEVETSLDPQLQKLLCDPGSLSQVMLNLIINAAHAVKEKQQADELGKIEIITQMVNESIEIRISDTGVGIPETVRDRIYDPFFTTKEIGIGTGQGLAISYDIVVNKHKGSIDCESEEGLGTNMILRFPTANKESES